MLSLKTSKKLKNAGLIWEPKDGDCFAVTDKDDELCEQGEIASTNIYVISGEHYLVEELGGRMVFFGGGLCVRGSGNCCNETHCYCMNKTGYNPNINVYSVSSWDKKLFVPRLDQLLAEIEKRGYHYALGNQIIKATGYQYKLTIYNYDQAYKIQDKDSFLITDFYANSPDEACAQALLWIIEQEVSQCK